MKSEFEAVAVDADFKVNEMELKIEQLMAENKELQASLDEQKAYVFYYPVFELSLSVLCNVCHTNMSLSIIC